MTDEFEFGVSKGKINDWLLLSQAVSDRYVDLPDPYGKYWRIGGSIEKFNATKIQEFREILEGKTGELKREIVLPYTNNLCHKGTLTWEIFGDTFNFSDLPASDYEKINGKLVEAGLSPLDWDTVKTLDGFAQECNISIRRVINNENTFEWKKYYNKCLDAVTLMQGPNYDFYLKAFYPISN